MGINLSLARRLVLLGLWATAGGGGHVRVKWFPASDLLCVIRTLLAVIHPGQEGLFHLMQTNRHPGGL